MYGPQTPGIPAGMPGSWRLLLDIVFVQSKCSTAHVPRSLCRLNLILGNRRPPPPQMRRELWEERRPPIAVRRCFHRGSSRLGGVHRFRPRRHVQVRQYFEGCPRLSTVLLESEKSPNLASSGLLPRILPTRATARVRSQTGRESCPANRAGLWRSNPGIKLERENFRRGSSVGCAWILEAAPTPVDEAETRWRSGGMRNPSFRVSRLSVARTARRMILATREARASAV
jgi:hypothetical protein